MKIHSLHIYPVKGMGGISVQTAKLEVEGLQYDRRWMLVDQNGKFISQRTHPNMTQFHPDIMDGMLKVHHKEDEIVILLDELTDNNIEVTVFDDQMTATEVSPSASDWFTKQFGEQVRLVSVSDATNRIKDFEKYLDSSITDMATTTTVSFADGYPYLILGTASMDLLNSKMEDEMKIDRFRANIVVETSEPHIEDTWSHIQIGSERLYIVRPCARCQVPTINQQTGLSGKQPNTALATYRRDGNKVNFGMNVVALTDGVISVGDEVT